MVVDVALTKTNAPANSASKATAIQRHWRTALGPQSLKRISNSTCRDSGCRSAMNGRKASIRRESVFIVAASAGSAGLCGERSSDREKFDFASHETGNASSGVQTNGSRAR